eukprot:6930609-Pyramimonas_sp.AAC.1
MGRDLWGGSRPRTELVTSGVWVGCRPELGGPPARCGDHAAWWARGDQFGVAARFWGLGWFSEVVSPTTGLSRPPGERVAELGLNGAWAIPWA